MVKSKLVRVSVEYAQLLESEKEKLGLHTLPEATHVMALRFRFGEADELLGQNGKKKKRKRKKGIDLFGV